MLLHVSLRRLFQQRILASQLPSRKAASRAGSVSPAGMARTMAGRTFPSHRYHATQFDVGVLPHLPNASAQPGLFLLEDGATPCQIPQIPGSGAVARNCPAADRVAESLRSAPRP